MKEKKQILKEKALMDHEMKEKIILYITGELGDEENKEIFDWINSSSGNMKYYQKLHTSMKAADFFSSGKQFDMEKVRARVNSRIEMEEPTGKTDFRLLFRIAASLVVLLSVFTAQQIIKDLKNNKSQTGLLQTIESPLGSRTRILLPDSTRVVLNAGSTLSYPVNYLDREEREVNLIGEGFFEVRKQKGSLFIVSVEEIKVAALGTCFNIKAYPGEKVIETTLVEGLLKIQQDDAGKAPVYLKPNEKLTIVKDTEDATIQTVPKRSTGKAEADTYGNEIVISSMHVEKEIDPAPEISWKEKEWVIRKKTMADLAVMLERRYNVKIVLDNEEVRKYRFSGTLKDETLEQVLFAIRATAPVDYTIEGNVVVLTHNMELQMQYQKILRQPAE